MAYLIDRLKSLGAFDHTAILWINPMNNGQVHNSTSIPIVLAGDVGGYFRTGRHVRFDADNEDLHVNDLHATILNSMGVEADTFGDPDKFTRTLHELVA